MLKSRNGTMQFGQKNKRSNTLSGRSGTMSMGLGSSRSLPSVDKGNSPATPQRSLDDYLNDFMNRFNSLPDDYRSQAVQELRSSYEDSARQGFMDAFKSIPDQYKRDALSAIGGFGY